MAVKVRLCRWVGGACLATKQPSFSLSTVQRPVSELCAQVGQQFTGQKTQTLFLLIKFIDLSVNSCLFENYQGRKKLRPYRVFQVFSWNFENLLNIWTFKRLEKTLFLLSGNFFPKPDCIDVATMCNWYSDWIMYQCTAIKLRKY